MRILLFQEVIHVKPSIHQEGFTNIEHNVLLILVPKHFCTVCFLKTFLSLPPPRFRPERRPMARNTFGRQGELCHADNRR